MAQRINERRKDMTICPHCTCQPWSLNPEAKECDSTTCMACETRVCMIHGTGKGACPVCLHGMLKGWSHPNQTCGYKGCTMLAVFQDVPRVRRCCKVHAERATVTVYTYGEGMGRRVTLAEIVKDYIASRQRAYQREA